MTGPADMPAGGAPAGGTLYVVATPIGNLADITLRALDVLRAVPLIAAEDTRLTRRLLDRYKIDVPLTSYHAKSGPGRTAALLQHLRGGADLALVSDAGTPVVSDPGGELVTAWAGEGGTVVALPGPSAVVTAVAVSGVAGPHWTFEGFLPRSGRERRERLARIAADARGAVVFEAPNRVAGTLRDLANACGPERPAAVCRELTKLHETVSRGTLADLAEAAGAARSRHAVSSCSSSVPGRGPGRRRANMTGRLPWRLPGRRWNDWSPTGRRDPMPRDAWRPRPACRDASFTGRPPTDSPALSVAGTMRR